MVERALHNAPTTQGLVMNASFPAIHSPGALAISSMAFQWLSDLPRVLERYKGSIKALAFSLPIFGSFQEWQAWCQRHNVPYKMNALHTKENLEELCHNICPQASFVKEENLFIPYEKPLDFLRDLKQMGAHTSLARPDVTNTCSLYRTQHQDPLFQGITYRVAYVLIYF